MKARIIASAWALAFVAGAMGGTPALAADKAKAEAKAAAKSSAATKAEAPSATTASDDAEAQKSAHATFYLKVLISALQSDEIKDDAKSTLVGCLYNASLGELTEVMDKVISENAESISRDKPSDILAVMTAVCGYKGNPTQPVKSTAPVIGR